MSLLNNYLWDNFCMPHKAQENVKQRVGYLRQHLKECKADSVFFSERLKTYTIYSFENISIKSPVRAGAVSVNYTDLPKKARNAFRTYLVYLDYLQTMFKVETRLSSLQEVRLNNEEIENLWECLLDSKKKRMQRVETTFEEMPCLVNETYDLLENMKKIKLRLNL